MKGRNVKIIVSLLFIALLTVISKVFGIDSINQYINISNNLNHYSDASFIEARDEIVYAALNASIKTQNTLNTSILYRDKIKQIDLTVNNVDYDENDYSIQIIAPNGKDDTSNWSIISKTKQNNTMFVTIKRSGDYPAVGSYTIKVVNTRFSSSNYSKVEVSFAVEGYYNYFTLSEAKMVSGTGHANVSNVWEVNMLGLSDEMLNRVSNGNIDNISVAISYNNKDVTTKNFKVSQTKEKILIENNTKFYNMPQSGTYKVTVTHKDSNFKETSFSTSVNFSINKRNIELIDKDSESHRYIRKIVDKKYAIKVLSLKNNNLTYYYDDGTEITKFTKTLDEFKKLYPNINLGSISYDESTYKTIFKFDDELTVKGITDTEITYVVTKTVDDVITTEEKISTIQEFKDLYQEAYEKLSTEYGTDESGNLFYIINDVVQEEVTTLDTKNLNVFALSGGKIIKTVSYKGIRKNEFTDFVPYIVKNGENICNNGKCETQDGFDLKCEYNPTDDNTGEITCTVDYTNVLEKYAGTYKIILPFKDSDEKSISFELFDQETDYYLTSQYDNHVFLPDELEVGVLPPANQRYEYYIGLYLIKGGKKQEARSNGAISTRIFDHHVDYETDEDGNPKKDSAGNSILRFYDVYSYQIRLNKYLKDEDKIDFDVSINGSDFENKTMNYETFKNQYQIDDRFPTCNKDNFLDCYKYDTDGNIVTSDDNFVYTNQNGKIIKMLIKSFKSNSSKTDIDVVYDEYNAAGKLTTKNKKMSLEKFKVAYPEMYNFIITKFVFDTDGNIMRGTFMGEYNVYEENGKKIEGKELTDNFNITVDYDDLTNVEKAVKILPKTEVQKGTYYVYTKYETMDAIGYINKNSIDPATGKEVEATISKDLYPEMWMQNIHMTSITYEEPKYELKVTDTKLSNSKNALDKMYYNISGSALFNVETNYIYADKDKDGNSLFNVTVKYEKDDSYIDATNNFKISSQFTMPESDTKGNGVVTLIPQIGLVKKGNYKLVINYTKEGITNTCEYEFQVSGKYYDISLEEETNISFAKNVEKQSVINMLTHYVNDIIKITPSIKRKIPGGSTEDFVLDQNTKTFKNELGEDVFTYSYSYHKIDNEQNNYQFVLKNVKNKATIGDYVLTLSYQEEGEEMIAIDIPFTVTKEEYLIELSNRTSKVNDEGMFINYDISTKNIVEEELDNVEYTIYYYDNSLKKYVDVSSENSENRMFKIRDNWDLTTGPDYKGKLIIELIQNKANMAGSYIIRAKYSTQVNEYELTDYGKSLKSLFEWNIDKVDISSVYKDSNETVSINGFYNNLNDVSIDVKISSPYEKYVSWTINKDCINGTCDPTVGTNYNDRFDANNDTLINQSLSLKLKNDLDDSLKLEEGKYALVLYYSSIDYKVYTFDVIDEYIDIIFDKQNTLIYSKINNDVISDGLFTNKIGKIYVPVKVRGPAYDNENIKINITSEDGTKNYNDYFSYNRLLFNEDHYLDIDYNPNKKIESGRYMLTVSFKNNKREVKDSLVFIVNKTYFNFYFKNTTYEPNPLIPNDENGGKIKYEIETEDIPNIQISDTRIDADSNKHVFSKNTKIYDQENNDVTNAFTITSTNSNTNLNSFVLNIEYKKNAIEPGKYRVVTYYEMDGYRREKEQSFEVMNYKKDFNVKETKIITDAIDGRNHTNISSVFEIYLESEFEIFASYMNVSVLDENDTDVTNKFKIEKYNDIIKLNYDKNNAISKGTYKIKLSYTEDENDVITKTIDYIMNGEYKEIKLSNMVPNNSVIYADQENMSYSMDVNTSIEEEYLGNLKARIFDDEDNIVYSDISTDNVTNSFVLINKVKDENKYYVNIIPFKARVGEYYIELYYYDEDGSFSASNRLSFTVDRNYYRLQLSSDSYVNPVIDYDSNIYDRDGAKGMYKFSSTYDNTKDDVYSIRAYKGKTLIDEVKIDITRFNENGVDYLKSEFITNALVPGDIDFYICINGLPYTSITKEVKKYIKIDNLKVIVDNDLVNDELEVYNGEYKTIDFIIEPSNATDKNILIESENEGIITITDDGRLKVVGVGNTKIKVKNNDTERIINIISKERLSSDVYSVSYDNHIISVLSMNKKSLSKQEFLNNLKGVVANYKILDKNNKDITSSVSEIGTSMSLVNGYETYKIVIIGDLNKDGKINVFDVSMLYSYVRGKTDLDEYSMLAARIRKQNDIKVADVSKLFSFVRDRISGI